jgi:hypothetical protein
VQIDCCRYQVVDAPGRLGILFERQPATEPP